MADSLAIFEIHISIDPKGWSILPTPTPEQAAALIALLAQFVQGNKVAGRG